MILENELCSVEVKIDPTYTMGSVDNMPYDLVHNLNAYKRGDHTKTFCVHITKPSGSLRIALIGDCQIYDNDCAVLENDVLTALQNDTIIQLSVTNGKVIRWRKLDTFGLNMGIYRIDGGYLLYGEEEITMLDQNLHKKWAFSGRDIFASVSGKEAFTICENSIQLFDFEDNYYEIDFEGNLLSQK